MQHDFILLDRSESMTILWSEALKSVNSYVEKLAEEKVDTGVTLATFDRNAGTFMFEIIRDRITPLTWKPVTNSDAAPRGSTPLNDATGRIVNLARAGNYDKVAIIIMTDGYENASHELTVEQVKALLNDCRAKGWQVIFLGANFDNAQQAASYGNAMGQTISATAANLAQTMGATASLRANYSRTGQSMTYSDEVKKKAASNQGSNKSNQ